MKISLATHGRWLQAGQALFECLLLASCLILLWLAGQWLGLAQQRAFRVGTEARRMVFQLAAGMAAQNLLRPQEMALSVHEPQAGPVGSAAGLPQVGGAAAEAAALRQEFGVQAGIASVYAQLPAPPLPHWLNIADARQLPALPGALTLLSGAGSGAGDAAVQQDIAASASAWRAAAHVSLARAQALDHVMHRVDAPWRPAHDPAAWLQHWAGAVPEPAGVGRRLQ